jgi:hypothetical protein
MRTSRPLVVLLWLLLLTGTRPVAAADVAVWVYDFPSWSENQWEARTAMLPQGTRHLYASMEDGPNFLLQDQLRSADIQRLVGILRERPGILTHAMILQDTRWLDDAEGAVTRLARVVALNRNYPDRAFAGIHVDVQPQTLEQWECGGVPERRALMQKLLTLFRRLTSAIPVPGPTAGKGGSSRLQLSAAFPWWIGSSLADIPEASPRRLFESLDEIVLTAYGDPGGPRIGGSAQGLLSRLEDPRLWRDIPPGKGLRIGLATYEYAGATDLLTTARELDKALANQKAYRGTAIFHSTGGYGAPLRASVRGLVQDVAGQPLARASVKIGERQGATNSCGRFVVRGLPTAGTALEVKTSGFRGVVVPVAGLAAGQELEIPPIMLERNP